MTERDYAPLSIACVRGLCDKLYEKRKFAGAEIEKMVKDFSDVNNTSQIKRLIRVLGQDLMQSTNPNVKNGALMGLSSVAVALGKDCEAYLTELTEPIIACAGDAEGRVRYQAAEALFNVLKVARGAALPLLAPLFDVLARLAADPEPQVRHGGELLDRLLKDIVTESETFSVSSLIPLVRARIYSRGAGARQLVLAWLSVLDAAPGPGLLPALPDLLDGLFHMLDDPMPEIRRMCDIQLSEFLRRIKKSPERAHFSAMVNTLIVHAQAPEELRQLTAITWLKEFVELCGRGILPHCSGVLLAALPCLAYRDDQRRNIRETATIVNFQLTKLVGSTTLAIEGDTVSEVEPPGSKGELPGPEREGEEDSGLNLAAVVEVLVQMLRHSSVHTKVAALDWLLHLYNKLPAEMAEHTEVVFAAALGPVSDSSHDVARRSLALLGEICAAPPSPGELETNTYFYKFLEALLKLLAADENLLEDRGSFIIRQLCVLLNAEEVYLALARILAAERRLRFVSAVVQLLSNLLLTAAELFELRRQLRAFQPPARRVFLALYGCWSHAPLSLLALCLLTHNYAHSLQLIRTFGDLEITVDFLTEVDKLVQLIESPIFAYMRLELLDGPEAASLRAALSALLMLLPQSEAFHTLRRRLACVPPVAPPAQEPAKVDIDFTDLLAQFERVQAAHREYRLLERRSPLDKGS